MDLFLKIIFESQLFYNIYFTKLRIILFLKILISYNIKNNENRNRCIIYIITSDINNMLIAKFVSLLVRYRKYIFKIGIKFKIKIKL